MPCSSALHKWPIRPDTRGKALEKSRVTGGRESYSSPWQKKASSPWHKSFYRQPGGSLWLQPSAWWHLVAPAPSTGPVAGTLPGSATAQLRSSCSLTVWLWASYVRLRSSCSAMPGSSLAAVHRPDSSPTVAPQPGSGLAAAPQSGFSPATSGSSPAVVTRLARVQLHPAPVQLQRYAWLSSSCAPHPS
ncbi:hypothetical protein GJAV_G00060590 [Gymnothorax javanicus]|nr:hypothetical protein GJAV_G00060590 [Gymnothorax javanicus]